MFEILNACLDLSTGCPKIIVPRLCGYCGGAADSIISVLVA